MAYFHHCLPSRYIHLSCLRQWQDTQRADGQHAVSCVCGICHTRWAVTTCSSQTPALACVWAKSVKRVQSHVPEGAAVHCRYRTDFQHRWRLRDKQKELASHCLEFSSAVMDMAASNPWKLLQRAFELGFFVNGLAQVQSLNPSHHPCIDVAEGALTPGHLLLSPDRQLLLVVSQLPGRMHAFHTLHCSPGRQASLALWRRLTQTPPAIRPEGHNIAP